MSDKDAVYRQDAIAKLKEHRKIFCKNRLDFTILPDKDKARVDEIDACISTLINLPSAQSEIIRCKDCKHKPHTSDKYDYNNRDCGFEIIFPDYRCPCRCDDEYYNRIPDDDWYCGNAERRTDG